jgi:hypothetical protein
MSNSESVLDFTRFADFTGTVEFREKDYLTLKKQLQKSVEALNRKFKSACYHYNKANKGLASHRLRNAQLDVINEDKSDFTLLDAQEQFAWLIHEIQTGPVLFAKDHIAEANLLIKSLEQD